MTTAPRPDLVPGPRPARPREQRWPLLPLLRGIVIGVLAPLAVWDVLVGAGGSIIVIGGMIGLPVASVLVPLLYFAAERLGWVSLRTAVAAGAGVMFIFMLVIILLDRQPIEAIFSGFALLLMVYGAAAGLSGWIAAFGFRWRVDPET